MEVYLNIIETGQYTYGVEAGAQRYYKKSANRLTKIEAASIASILPLPLKWSPVKPNSRVANKITVVREQMDYFTLPESFVKH